MRNAQTKTQKSGCTCTWTFTYLQAQWSAHGIAVVFSADIIPLSVFYFLGVGRDWVHLARRPLFGLLHRPQMTDDEYGAVGGMIGRGNGSTRRSSAPVQLPPSQIPHYQARSRTWIAAVGSKRLTACATAQPCRFSFRPVLIISVCCGPKLGQTFLTSLPLQKLLLFHILFLKHWSWSCMRQSFCA
jgi:hypothetical protein